MSSRILSVIRRPTVMVGALVTVLAAALIMVLVLPGTQPPTGQPTGEQEASTSPDTSPIRNVVVIMADDLDWATFTQVPRLNGLMQRGTTFLNHTVTESLCCPSRVSFLRGQYVHNHQVVSNLAETGGGWPTFARNGGAADCLPVWLADAGVDTALMGKYLNDYPEKGKRTLVPPGWNQWAVPVTKGSAYTGYNYKLNVNGSITQYGSAPKDFLPTVLDEKAATYLRDAEEPFFLFLSSYQPHKPYATAPAHVGSHAGERAPRGDTYNKIGRNSPDWLTEAPTLTPRQLTSFDRIWQKRLESTETFADSVDFILGTLEATGRADDTLVIITSDNGYHAGSRRLPFGKRTPYREDAVVPLLAIGPGVEAGRTVREVTSMTDLAPTITDAFGAPAPDWVDGASLLPMLTEGAPWPRSVALTESLGISRPGDPDYQAQSAPSFAALRSPDFLYVEYATGEREYHDLGSDRAELHNTLTELTPQRREQLHQLLVRMSSCSGSECRAAAGLEPSP